MLRSVTLALVFTGSVTACVRVSASLPSSPADPPRAASSASSAEVGSALTQAAAPEPDPSSELRLVDSSSVFDGEIELLAPQNLLALKPFGRTHVGLEFEQSWAKPERQRKLPGPWEGQLDRWLRSDPNLPEASPLLEAIARRPTWSLAPAGCDDARGQCYVREASTRWIERAYDEHAGRAEGLLEIAASTDEAGPSRFLLVTTLTRGAYVYSLIYELHAEEWRAHEPMLRASARSFTIK